MVINVEDLENLPKLQEVNKSILINITRLNDIDLLHTNNPDLRVANFFINPNEPSMLNTANGVVKLLTIYPQFDNFGFVTFIEQVIIFQPIKNNASCISDYTLLHILSDVPSNILNKIQQIKTFYIGSNYGIDQLYKYIPKDNIIILKETPRLMSNKLDLILNKFSVGFPLNATTTHILNFINMYNIIKLYLPSNTSEEESSDIKILHDDFDGTHELYRKNKFIDMIYLYLPENIEGFIEDITLLNEYFRS